VQGDPLQAEDPDKPMNVPGTHAVHAEAPAESKNVPELQGVQAEAPDPFMYVPAVQRSQFSDEVAPVMLEYDPLLQAAQK